MNKSLWQRGFTMVELLVVIAIIAILAVVVLATLNPLEQINKSRDARIRADAGNLINAIERFYVNKECYPWDWDPDDPTACKDKVKLEANEASDIGVWTQSVLQVETEEVKEPFAKRIGDYVTGDDLFLFKDTGASSSVFVCFEPRSEALKDEAAERCSDTSWTDGATTDPCGEPIHFCVP